MVAGHGLVFWRITLPSPPKVANRVEGFPGFRRYVNILNTQRSPLTSLVTSPSFQLQG